MTSELGVIYIHDHPWYFRLKTGSDSRSLLSDYRESELYQHLVVCFTPFKLPGSSVPFINQKGQPGRLYGYFDSYVEYYKYCCLFDIVERSFFEVIFGSLPQKPHFDIDIKASDYNDDVNIDHENMSIDDVCDQLLDLLIEKCCEVLEKLGVKINLETDILLYSSHSEQKRSYHLVINNYCHANNLEAKAFYTTVINLMSDIVKYTGYIDHGVYSVKQQFRIAGCQKQYSGRPKIYHQQFYYKNQLITHRYEEEFTDQEILKMIILRESLVSFTSGCEYIPSLIPDKPESSYNLEGRQLEESDVDRCIDLMNTEMNYPPFKVHEVIDTLIILRRCAPSLCPLCHRIHELENPFIFISMGNAYWNCRRNPTNKLFLGQVFEVQNSHIQLQRMRDPLPDNGVKELLLSVKNKVVNEIKIQTNVIQAVQQVHNRLSKRDDIESKIISLDGVMDSVPWVDSTAKVVIDDFEPKKKATKRQITKRLMMDDVWAALPW